MKKFQYQHKNPHHLDGCCSGWSCRVWVSLMYCWDLTQVLWMLWHYALDRHGGKGWRFSFVTRLLIHGASIPVSTVTGALASGTVSLECDPIWDSRLLPKDAFLSNDSSICKWPQVIWEGHCFVCLPWDCCGVCCNLGRSLICFFSWDGCGVCWKQFSPGFGPWCSMSCLMRGNAILEHTCFLFILASKGS